MMFMPMLWNDHPMHRGPEFGPGFDEMDAWMRDFWGSGLEAAQVMKTDVKENENSFELQSDLPGFNKEDIHIDMKDGILRINASHNENKDEQDENGRYIRRERHVSSYERIFRVPKDLQPEDVDARYENGVLTVTLPKKEALPQKEEPMQIEVK